MTNIEAEIQKKIATAYSTGPSVSPFRDFFLLNYHLHQRPDLKHRAIFQGVRTCHMASWPLRKQRLLYLCKCKCNFTLGRSDADMLTLGTFLKGK